MGIFYSPLTQWIRLQTTLPEGCVWNNDKLLVSGGKFVAEALFALLNGQELEDDLEHESWQFFVDFKDKKFECRVYQFEGKMASVMIRSRHGKLQQEDFVNYALKIMKSDGRFFNFELSDDL